MGHSLRRSPRLAAKTIGAEAADEPLEASEVTKKAARKASRRASKSPTRTKSSRKKPKESKEAKKAAAPARRRSSRIRKNSSCSLQSLDQTPRQPRLTRKARRSASPSPPPASNVAVEKKPPTTPRAALTPAARSKRPVPAVTPSTAAKARGVTFDLGRNSFAEYRKENPPSVVDRLDEHSFDKFNEAHVPGSPTNDDETRRNEAILSESPTNDDETRRNEAILSEWDGSFDELDDGDDDWSAQRRARRKTLTSRRVSMSP